MDFCADNISNLGVPLTVVLKIGATSLVDSDITK